MPAVLEKARSIAKTVADDLAGWVYSASSLREGRYGLVLRGQPKAADTGMVTMITQWQGVRIACPCHHRLLVARLRNPSASAVIYGGMEAKGIRFEGVDEALAECRDVDEARKKVKQLTAG